MFIEQLLTRKHRAGNKGAGKGQRLNPYSVNVNFKWINKANTHEFLKHIYCGLNYVLSKVIFNS